jgi:uncharacterized protein YndB with AHSA1/START domain
MKALCCIAAAGLLFAQSPVTVVRQSEPKALIFEVTIPAPRSAVWRAFTTSEGLSTWLTLGAVVDLRKGGEWTAHFPGGGTGSGTIVGFVPEEEITLAALAPERFPHVRADRTTVRFQFVGKGEYTLVKLTQTGWKSGEEWDRAYEYLARGNAQLLETLLRRFVSGPIDWAKEMGRNEMNLATLNPWAVLTAALSAFLVGGLWYSPALFGSLWKKANRFATDEPPAATGNTFAVSFVLSLAMALNLTMFRNDSKTTLAWGAAAGFLAGFGWVAMGIGVVALFEHRPWTYVLVNGGYLTVALVLMGAILGAWR